MVKTTSTSIPVTHYGHHQEHKGANAKTQIIYWNDLPLLPLRQGYPGSWKIVARILQKIIVLKEPKF